MTTYFCSDTHLGHRNIVELSHRPFASLKEMEDTIVNNWNARVSPQDEVFHLGDFCFGNKNFQTEMLARLRGRITIVRGNHDRSTKSLRDIGFHYVTDEAEFTDTFRRRWYLAHKPWWEMRDGAIGPQWQLCGHVHNDWKRLADHNGRETEYDIVNVGVDVWDFTPRTFEELNAAEAKFMPLVDAMLIPHHGEM